MRYCLWLPVFWSFFNAAMAKTVEITCPERIETHQQLLKTPVKFTEFAIETAPSYWNTITFYQGNPKQQASLAPKVQKNTSAHWEFSPNDRIYFSCGYYQTQIELYQQLPRNTQSCTVTYNPEVQSNSGFLPKKIRCEVK